MGPFSCARIVPQMTCGMTALHDGETSRLVR